MVVDGSQSLVHHDPEVKPQQQYQGPLNIKNQLLLTI